MRIELPDSVKSWRKSAALTPQEFKILGLAVMGSTDSQISAELSLSRPALATAWRKILSKVGAASRAESLIKYAERLRASQLKSLQAVQEQATGEEEDPVDREARELSQRKLLAAISDASVSYINGRQNVRQVYSRILDDLLSLTQSHYGLVGEVKFEKGVAVLGEHALTCTGWDAAAQALYERNIGDRMMFRTIDPIFSEAVRKREIVILDDSPVAVEKQRVMQGHPVITTFIGIPIYCGLELVGVIGLANRRGGYTKEMAEFLKPMMVASANITVAWRLEASHRRMERELDATTCLMRTMVDRSSSACLYETEGRSVEFINTRFATMFGIEAAPEQVVGMNTALFVLHSKKLFADPDGFIKRVDNLIGGQETCYGERVTMADGRKFLRDFVVVRSGISVCGYFWHYRDAASEVED